MEWLRRLVRKNTRPIPRHTARYYRDRLSVGYYMLAWTAAGAAFYRFLNHDPDYLPDDLNVHVDPNAPKQPNIYQAADKIKKSSDDMEVKIINIKNFTIESIEPYKAKSLQEKMEDTENRAKEDFFGGTEGREYEESEDEECNLSM